jgi:hypothetical protein
MQVQHLRWTVPDRYPEVFDFLKARMAEKPAKRRSRILSVGCSSGEEIDAIRRRLPEAEIVGVDISRESIDLCSARFPDVQFFCADFFSETPLRFERKFDAILVLSVLCKWPACNRLNNLSALYRFSEFESAIDRLDAHIEIGGLLVLVNTNYAFSDTRIASRYQAIANLKTSGFVRKFLRDGRRRTVLQYRLPRVVADWLWYACVYVRFRAGLGGQYQKYIAQWERRKNAWLRPVPGLGQCVFEKMG